MNWSNRKSSYKNHIEKGVPNETPHTNKGKTVFIKSTACFRTSMLKDYHAYFIKNGFVITNDLQKADYIFMITCAFVESRIKEITEYVAHIQRFKKAGAKIIIAGCLPKVDKEILSGEKDIIQIESDSDLDKLFFSKEKIGRIGSKNVYANFTPKVKSFSLLWNGFRVIKNLTCRTDYYIKRFRRVKGIEGENPYDLFYNPYDQFHNPYDPFYDPNSWFYIVINTGCLYNCTYCAIKNIVGKPVSKPITKIIEEFKQGLSLNFKKFYLSSDNIGFFNDEGHNFIDLVTAINHLKGNFAIKIHHIHPSWLINNIDSFENALSKKKIRSITVPVQSGNDRILKKMGRHYTREDIKSCFKRLNSKFPFLSLHTQFIVGFPSETEDEFQDSVTFLDGVSISSKFPSAVFKYSDMKGTAASRYKGKVDSDIKQRRQDILKRRIGLNWLNKTYSLLRYGV